MQRRSIPRGQRLYAILRAVDDSETGIWTTDYRNLRSSHLGATGILQRNPFGHPCPTSLSLSLLARVGLFALRNKYWRLL
ncbi:MAG TPA: hypothetical protein V6D29_15465 [Leptolyngbyaceae cyanobacterium]